MTQREKFRWRYCPFVLAGIVVVLIVLGYRSQESGIGDLGLARRRSDSPVISHSPIPTPKAGPSDQVKQARLGESYGKLPLSFEQNQGQVDGRVKFLSRGNGYTLFLTANEAVLALSRQSSKPQAERQPPRTRSSVLRMKLVGANPSPQVAGLAELPGKSNYFIGSNPANWRTNIATYARVKYQDVYPGIDLVYYGNQKQLEYDWIVSPGAAPGAIRFTVEGAKKMKVDSNGDLVLAVGGGEVRLHKPVVYQETEGARHQIAGGFVRRSDHEVGFRIAEYDPAKPLVIDPVLFYSTYHGGSGRDYGSGIAVDSLGSAYMIGVTDSTNFPTVNAFQPASAGSWDVFVTKFNPEGNAVIYSTFLGGTDSDFGQAIAVDSLDNAYLAGYTRSTDFPLSSARQPVLAGFYDAFVTKFNSSGNALVYSTYHGGSDSDEGYGIAVDPLGNAYMTGRTLSANFPTANPLQPAYGGGVFDAFVSKFNPLGNALIYSTYHGGSDDDEGYGIAVDPSGNAYVTGFTFSFNFPLTNPLQSVNAGSGDAFVTKVNASGSALIYSTFLGGSGQDIGTDIAADSLGNAYVTGQTPSANFPMANALQPTHAGGTDAFVTKLNPSGSGLVYSTFLGGNGFDGGCCFDFRSGIAADSSGNAYVTGFTDSTNFPTVNPVQSAYAGGLHDAFVTKFNSSGSALLYSTYHGGGGDDYVDGIAVDASGNAYVVGITDSTNFPTASARQPVHQGGVYDAFLTKFGDFNPSFEITMSAAAYIDGQTVTASEFKPINPRPLPAAVKLRVWLSVPGAGEVNLIDIGADGSFFFPASLNQNIGPLSLFLVTPQFPPKGNWQFNSRIENPTTGAPLNEDINSFVIQ